MDKLIDLINQGGTGEYDARQPQERGEAVRIGTLILGGIEDGEWNDNDFDFDGESVHELQRRLVTGEPLHIDIYHPAPSVSAWVPNAVALAYGLLWHVNAGMDAPADVRQPSLTPEKAAYEARKVLRDLMTKDQRGDGINAARVMLTAPTASGEGEEA